MGKTRSVAAPVGKKTKKAKARPKEAKVPPKDKPAPKAPVVEKPKPVEAPVAPVVAPPIEPKPVAPVVVKPAAKPEKVGVLVKVNGKLITFDGSAPLLERGLRNLRLFPDRHRIYLQSRGQTRQFHGGEVLGTIPDDLEIITRE